MHNQEESKTEENKVMDEIQKYWRDRVEKLLTWGTGILLLIASYAVKEAEMFELKPFDFLNPNCLRAMFLIILSITFFIVYSKIIHHIYDNHLNESKKIFLDATVIDKKVVYRFVNILCAVVILIALLASIL